MESSISKPISLFAFIIVIVCQSVLAEIIQVPKDHATIQAGIDAAVDGDTVLVADGLYVGVGNVNLNFKGKPITVKSASGAYKCTIDCQKTNQTRGFTFHHRETKDAIVSGFTIKNGNFKKGNGGGIHCFDASPTIISCILTENVAEAGGGIFCDNAFTIIIDCLITKNQAKGGGGIQSHRSSPTITGCRIGENTAGTGGGVFLTESSVVVTNTLVYKNQADYGGGVLCWSGSLLFLHSCTITDNIAMYGGGLFFSESDTMLVNSILHQNSGRINNEPQQIYFGKSDQSTVADISYCLIQGGRTGVISDETVTLKWGSGNISNDPMFVNPTAGDYRLQDNSLGIASGIKDDSMPTVDIEGHDRPLPAESRPDLGAYEHNRGKRVSDQPDDPLPAISPGVLITTNKGQIRLEVYPESAPITVKNFYRLIQEQFYDGLTFHRYVPKFVIQGGCPLGTGAGGPGWTIRGEFQDPSLRSKMPKHTRGVLAMARAQAPDSAGSQFYICLENAPHLDGNYTAFGQVINGMEVVDQLRQGDKMISVQLIADTSVPRLPSIITIPDTNLRARLEEVLGKNAGEAITKDDLVKLKELKAEHRKISDLTGLEHCTNLTYLNLNHNQISNLSPLVNLTNLVMLELHYNQLKQLDVLADANLPSLELLSILSNQISDLKGLVTANLPNLARLYLNNNQIDDVSQLIDNTGSLGEINLKNNPLNSAALFTHIPALKTKGIKIEYDMPEGIVLFKDASLEKAIRTALGIPTELLKKEDLKRLTKLSARDAEISDITGIENCVNLYFLDLGVNGISDISALRNLKSLRYLCIEENKVPDISALAELVNLRDGLRLSLNGISDISPLKNLVLLKGELNLSHNNISDISPLATLTNLTGLNICCNNISNLSTLKNLKQLKYLAADSNNISDISPIQDLTKLKTLFLTNNFISGINSLIENKGVLGEIKLQNNPLSKESVFIHIPELQARGISVLFDPIPNSKLSFSKTEKVSVNQLFAVNILVDEVSNLVGWTTVIEYSMSMLELQSAKEGDALDTKGKGTFFQEGKINNQSGTLMGLSSVYLGTGGVEASGILVTLTFKAIKDGQSYLRFKKVKFSNPKGKVIPVDIVDTTITVSSVPPCDVNADGSINIFDLILVAQSFGQEVKARVDTNGDGVVSIFDLIVVAQCFGQDTAPTIVSQPTAIFSMVENWVHLAETTNDGSVEFDQGIVVLKEILSSIKPAETVLMANYPNPFNPETWIPYHLSQDAEVVIRIYDANGRIVRTLDVGFQSFGYYVSCGKAAYWDGKTDIGEIVSSGSYFCQIQAGDYTETRKMVILK